MTHGMSCEQAIADMEQFGTNSYWNDAIKRRIRQLEREQETASK
jgi:hypothetical protein